MSTSTAASWLLKPPRNLSPQSVSHRGYYGESESLIDLLYFTDLRPDESIDSES
jgi:hypothetical protein